MELTGCADCNELTTTFRAKYPNPADDLAFLQAPAGDLSNLDKSRDEQCAVRVARKKEGRNDRHSGVFPTTEPESDDH